MRLPVKLKVLDWGAFLLSLVIFAAFTVFGWNRGGETSYLLVETQDGKAIYPLSEDRTITVEGPVGVSVIRIEDGEAAFIHSDCPDKLCVQSGAVSGPGEWAACLPNRVIISTTGEEREEPDAVVF